MHHRVHQYLYHHPHIEQLIIKKEDFPEWQEEKDLLQTLQSLYNSYESDSRHFTTQKSLKGDLTTDEQKKLEKASNNINNGVVKAILPLQNNSDSHHGVSLLTTGTYLNQELLNAVETGWLNFSEPLIKGGLIDNPDAFLDMIKGEGYLRDYLKLKAIYKILEQAKYLRDEVGEDDTKLDSLMQNITQLSDKLYEKWGNYRQDAKALLEKTMKDVAGMIEEE